jgi:hypothetical protein
MSDFDLRDYLADNHLLQEKMSCPIPTQDLEVNTRNRNSAIKADYIKYGPLNLNDEEYWEKAAEHWLPLARIPTYSDIKYTCFEYVEHT